MRSMQQACVLVHVCLPMPMQMAEAQKEEEERAAADKAAGLEPGSIRASTETASVSNSGSGDDNTSKLQSKDSAMVLTPPVEVHEQDVRSAQAATDAIERTNSLTKQSGSSTSASDSAAAAKSPNALVSGDTCDKVTDAEVNSSLAAMEEGDKIDLAEPTRKEFWQIFFLVWITVTREGIESVVFLGGVGSSVKPQVCATLKTYVQWVRLHMSCLPIACGFVHQADGDAVHAGVAGAGQFALLGEQAHAEQQLCA